MDWKERAAQLKFDEGVSWTKLPEVLENEFGEPFTTSKVRDYLRRHPKYKGNEEKTIDIKAELFRVLEKGQDLETLCDTLNTSKRVLKAYIEDFKEEGYQVEEIEGAYKLCKDIVPKENIYDENWKGEKVFRFGVVSDNHIGSKWQQITFLKHLYEIFQSEGITTVYNPGDITEGVDMRRGHQYEVFLHGADEQVQYVIENYPQHKGIITKFITGNHDHSSIKNAGYDIGRAIARERKDMIYLGQSNAKVNLTPNCTVELNHALDGAAYALSYAIQKRIDAMSGGDKPSILLDGHHHKMIYLFYRNIHAFECGTTQSQTPWMRGKRLPAHIGGWIIEAHVDEEGTITRCKGEFMPLYKPIENDY